MKGMARRQLLSVVLVICMLLSAIGSTTFVSAAEEAGLGEDSILHTEEYQDAEDEAESSEITDLNEESSETERFETEDSENETSLTEEESVGQNLKITSWNWIDEEEYLVYNEENARWELALLGVNEEQVLTKEDLAMFLPAEIQAVLENGTEETLAISWALDEFPEEGLSDGSHFLLASLPEGYELAEETAALQADFVLGGAMMLDASASISVGGLTITADDGQALAYGTAAGAEYEIYTVSNVIYVQTSRALTVQGTTTTHGIAVVAGKHAEITLNNVSIKASCPINVITNSAGVTRGYQIAEANRTSLHLTLADHSTNHLFATGQCAAIHCGEGSKLVIDDSRHNIDSNGNMITPEGGRIPYSCVLQDGTTLEKGNPSWYMDSAHPGELYVNTTSKTAGTGTGAYSPYAAGIGGGPLEDCGSMIFNGGIIYAAAYQDTNTAESSGAGIGGGNGAGMGCSEQGGGVIINGGEITASASYHGAAIGAGWSNSTGTLMAGSLKTVKGGSAPAPGDIIINGGYTTAKGGTHGNGFGGACGSGDNVGHGGSASASHVIRITGGTLIPSSNNNGTQWDVGAKGGSVVVTGGSFMVAANSGSASKYSLQGASVVSGDGTELTLVTIDLSNYSYTDNEGQTKKLQAGDYLVSYAVTVDGTPVTPEYGLATKLDNTKKLYFWLPSSSKGKSVAISGLILRDADGNIIDTKYPFTLDEVGKGDGVTKRYVTFTVDETVFSDALKKMLNKRYDGTAFDYEQLNKEIAAQNISVPQPDEGRIDDVNSLKEVSVRLKDADGKATNESSTEEGFSAAGTYSITVNYVKYATDPEFSATFWGHQTTISSVITRADTRVLDVDYQYSYKNGLTEDTATSKTDFSTMTLTANVLPADGEALTCEAPSGTVQFYINGVKVGSPVALTPVKTDAGVAAARSRARARAMVTGQAQASGYNYSTATLTMDYNTSNYLVPEGDDGEFKVTAKYLGSGNYTLSNGQAEEMNEPAEFPFTTVPGSVVTPEETKELDPDVVVPVLETLEPDYDIVDEEDGNQRLTAYYKDAITRKAVKPEEGSAEEAEKLGKDELAVILNERYAFTNNINKPLTNNTGAMVSLKADDIVITDAEGNEVTEITLSEATNYKIVASVKQDDAYDGNVVRTGAVLTIDYKVVDVAEAVENGTPEVDVDTDGDGYPDINIDTDDDGEPDVNLDTDGTGKPDTNVDTDDDGKPDVNVDTDGDGKPDVNIVDKDGDGKPDNIDPKDPDQDKTPDINIVDKDGDGEPDDLDDLTPEDLKDLKPDVNIDTDGDGKPDTNVDTDDDGKPDVNVDTDGDGKPDVNIVDKDGDGKPDNIDPKDPDQDKTPDVNIVDKDGDGKPDDLDDLTPEDLKDLKPDVNIDTDGDGKPDTNVDTDDDGKPDVNVDTDGDGKPDVNIVDKDGDGKPDNIDPKDPDQDKTPDVNIVDKDGDGKPDDLDDLTPEDLKDLKPDVNVDTDGDGKPDTNVDTDDDGKPDVNVDTDGDGKPDVNIIDKDGDGKPDDLDDLTPEDLKDLKPDVNVDTDGDGKPNVNVDTTGDGKPNINIVDKDGDGKPDTGIVNKGDQTPLPDVNVDTDGDGKPDVNVDTTGDGKPNLNIIDKDGDGKPDQGIDPSRPGNPNVNVDLDGDGKPDLNIDTDGDGKPDQNIDADGDGKIDHVGPATGDQTALPFVVGLMIAVLGIALLLAAKKRIVNR